MKQAIDLFKAVKINSIGISATYSDIADVLKRTLEYGFVFSPEVISGVSAKHLEEIIDYVKTTIGLSSAQMNNAFHKSWEKIKTASIEQLVLDQFLHYMTTYGAESSGVYDESSVYIPEEKVDSPEFTGLRITLIKGYTLEQLKTKLSEFLNSGIALAEDTVISATSLAIDLKFDKREIEPIENKEVKISLYKHYNIVPKNPVEFLRYALLVATGKTLLIKNGSTINEIKETENILEVQELFRIYKKDHGFEKLAEIFNRFKPLFLAFRNIGIGSEINRISKLSKKFHKPMEQDILNSVTAMIKHNEPINVADLDKALENASIFRKARLAYALKFRTCKDIDSIVYRIRNGKGYATEFSFPKTHVTENVLNKVIESIVSVLARKICRKKIFIPENIRYALPSTEKQFTGFIPSGTCIVVPENLIFGIWWENMDSNRIDLDLSLIDKDKKFGWDGSFINDEQSILFSGDITDAPNGASELFYIKKKKKSCGILQVNYYNYNKEIVPPFKILVGCQKGSTKNCDSVIHPNNVIATATTKADKKQKLLGLVVSTVNESRFYFCETNIGCSISSLNDDVAKQSRDFLFNFYENSINLNKILDEAGATLVDKIEDCDIDLSPENLEKDTFVKLLT